MYDVYPTRCAFEEEAWYKIGREIHLNGKHLCDRGTVVDWLTN